jgi:hypothetical protein
LAINMTVPGQMISWMDLETYHLYSGSYYYGTFKDGTFLSGAYQSRMILENILSR